MFIAGYTAWKVSSPSFPAAALSTSSKRQNTSSGRKSRMHATPLGQYAPPMAHGEQGKALLTTTAPRWHPLHERVRRGEKAQRPTPEPAAKWAMPELLATTYGAAYTAAKTCSQSMAPQEFIASSEERPRTRSFALARCAWYPE